MSLNPMNMEWSAVQCTTTLSMILWLRRLFVRTFFLEMVLLATQVASLSKRWAFLSTPQICSPTVTTRMNSRYWLYVVVFWAFTVVFHFLFDLDVVNIFQRFQLRLRCLVRSAYVMQRWRSSFFSCNNFLRVWLSSNPRTMRSFIISSSISPNLQVLATWIRIAFYHCKKVKILWRYLILIFFILNSINL